MAETVEKVQIPWATKGYQYITREGKVIEVSEITTKAPYPIKAIQKFDTFNRVVEYDLEGNAWYGLRGQDIVEVRQV